METLRARFRGRAGDEAQRLIAALDAGDRSEILRVSHSLAGNAGMFGFAALGQQAALSERAIEEGTDTDRLVALTHALIATLRAISSGECEEA
jgi:HPt (histidine-containing phosphotransfer) domain-containing protein